jgi:hypothetical protein
MLIRLILLIVLIALIPITAAESANKKKEKKNKEPAAPTSHMVLEKQFLCQEDFSKGMPPKPMWNPDLVGAWTVTDGILTGSEREKDKHSGVIFANVKDLPSTCVIRFRFRLGEMNYAEIMGQGEINKAQRVTFIMQIHPDGFRLGAMPDKHADPVENDLRWFPKVTQTLDRQTWYLMTLELNGDEALAWTDEQHVSYVRDPVFLKPRWGISLRANGKDKTGSYDDVWLTSGVVAPGWEKLRPRFEAAATKPPQR